MPSLGRVYDNLMIGLAKNSKELLRIQTQISSGSKVNRISDSPTEASQIMDARNQYGTLNSYIQNLNQVTMNMESASSVLQEISNQLINLTGLMTQAASDTMEITRDKMALSIDILLDQMLSLVNRDSLGQYLFGGGSKEPPYVANYDAAGKITSVEYVGGTDNSKVLIAPGVSQPITFVGKSLFYSDQRPSPQFFGSTGARAGSGTSTVRGDVWMTVEHGTTTYGEVEGFSTGVAAAANSDTGDTIIGTGHVLHLNVNDQTVSLDDGEAVAYELTDTSLVLTNKRGEVVHVDMSNVTVVPGGPYEIPIAATAKVSIDGGESYVSISGFGENEAIIDSRDGRVLYVDARNMERVGSEPVRVEGTYDLFEMLISARDVLENTEGLSLEQQTSFIHKLLNSLEDVLKVVTGNLTIAGGRLQALDSFQARMEDMQLELDTKISALQDADVIELAAQLAKAQIYYEMLLNATAKVLNLSLLDYI